MNLCHMHLKSSIYGIQYQRNLLIWIIVLTVLAGIILVWCTVHQEISHIDEKLEMLESTN